MRRKVNLYLLPEQEMKHRAEARRDGVSLSAHLARRLSVRDEIDELLGWMAARFDRIDERLNQAPPALSDDRLLALVGLDQLSREMLVGILRDVKEELAGLNAKQREHFIAKGRELLARANGAGK